MGGGGGVCCGALRASGLLTGSIEAKVRGEVTNEPACTVQEGGVSHWLPPISTARFVFLPLKLWVQLHLYNTERGFVRHTSVAVQDFWESFRAEDRRTSSSTRHLTAAALDL